MIPRDDKYFTMLAELAARIAHGCGIFIQLFSDFENHIQYAEKIKNVEVECDVIAAKITSKLNSSFITPIDREDIYLLTTRLDDIIDLVNGLARRFDIYGVTEVRAQADQVAHILNKCAHELELALRNMEKHEGVQDQIKAVNDMEKDADHIYREAIRRLFLEEKNALEVIKWMAIYDSLEESVDRCKDVSELLESIVVKNK
ncbi:MAG: DUF47 family protein [Spirochaetia bacterium]|nr:DUF47 family protein [Spirochaetia bacterium]